MQRTILHGLLVAAAACSQDCSDAPAPPARAAPVTGPFASAWYVLRIAGQDIGCSHVHSLVRDNVVQIVTETWMWGVWSGGQVRRVRSFERATDGTLLRVLANFKRSMHEIETDVRFESNKAVLLRTVMGKTRESRIDLPAPLLGPNRTRQMLLEDSGPKRARKIETSTFDAELNGPVTLEFTVAGEEEVELLDGRTERLVRVATASRGLPVVSVEWQDASGNLRKSITQVNGYAMETYLVTEERARRGGKTDPPEFDPHARPAPRHAVPSPRRIENATYRVRVKKHMPDLADDRQAIVRTEGETIILRVDRKLPPPGSTSSRPIETPRADVAAYLAASSMVQSDESEIVTIARDVVGNEPDAWVAAQQLERWVSAHVRSAPNIEFGSALEVARTREGDCTECAVLLCALCRAAGIPARCVGGLYFHDGMWTRHAWNEVWIEASWYALDGTLGHGSADPARIAVSRMTLEDTAFAEEFLGFVRELAVLEIEPIEVVLNGHSLQPGEEAARIQGTLYENTAWGLAFTCPRGWRFLTVAPGDGLILHLASVENEAGARIDVGVLDTVRSEDWEQIRKLARLEEGGCRQYSVDGRPAFRACSGHRVFALGARGAFVFESTGDTADATFLDFLNAVHLDLGPK